MNTARLHGWLFVLPSLAVGIAVTAYFWTCPPISDGAIYHGHSETVWQRPFSLANFTMRHPDFRFFSLALLGLTYRLGVETVVAVRILQLLLYGIAVATLYKICCELFPRISGLEAGLAVFAFAVNPALLAYEVGVALDYIALPFHLLYLLMVMKGRWLAAAAAAVALAFSKETGFLLYGATLPVAFWWSAWNGQWKRAELLRPLPLLAPLLLYFLYLAVEGRSIMAASAGAPECGEPGLALLLAPNFTRPEIQNYYFNLFVLNFAWLLLIPVALAAVRLFKDTQSLAERFRTVVDTRKVFLTALFLLAWIWVFTRCPLYNNVKYVLNAMPLWLLLSVALARAAIPRAWMRVGLLLVVVAAFAVSDVMSIDPLSRHFYGVTPTEKRPMLCMGSRIYPPGDCGNDDIMYNLQRFL